MLIGDGMMGQMKEPVVFPEPVKQLPEKKWALKGRGEGPSRYLASQEIANCETRYELYMMEDAEYAVVAYGTTARIIKGAIKRARREGIPVGLIRPITLFPFPEKILQEIAHRIKGFLVFEMRWSFPGLLTAIIGG